MLVRSDKCYLGVTHVTSEWQMLVGSDKCYLGVTHVTREWQMLVGSDKCYLRVTHVTSEWQMLVGSDKCYLGVTSVTWEWHMTWSVSDLGWPGGFVFPPLCTPLGSTGCWRSWGSASLSECWRSSVLAPPGVRGRTISRQYLHWFKFWINFTLTSILAYIFILI